MVVTVENFEWFVRAGRMTGEFVFEQAEKIVEKEMIWTEPR